MANSKGITWPLKEVPEDIQRLVLQEQAELKKKCKCQKSIPTTIYSIIRKLAEPAQNLP